MQSNNPIFRRSEEFNRGGANLYGNQTTPATGRPWPATARAPTRPSGPSARRATPARAGHDRPDDHRLGGPEDRDHPRRGHPDRDGDLDPDAGRRPESVTADLGPLFALVTIGSLGAFALSMVNSFKRVISPALVLAFAALEGVALGGISKVFNLFYPGVVMGAVLGTFAAFAGTLAAYKFLNIKVGDMFRRGVIAAVFGMVGLSLMALVSACSVSTWASSATAASASCSPSRAWCSASSC